MAPWLRHGPTDLSVCGAELDTLIARQRDFYAARGEAVEWKTRAHDLPADLADRLTAAGFVAEDSETVVIGQSADLAADPVLPDGVTLRRVTARSDLRRTAALESTVWGEDWSWLADDLAARIENAPENTIVLVAEARTEVVCAAWLLFNDGVDFGGLWGGSTLKEWRGQGVYGAMVAQPSATRCCPRRPLRLRRRLSRQCPDPHPPWPARGHHDDTVCLVALSSGGFRRLLSSCPDAGEAVGVSAVSMMVPLKVSDR